MRRRHLHTVGEIAELLNERIEALAAELLPAGRREGHEWRVGSVAGEPGKSLAVRLYGRKRGVWRDFAAGIGGDALDLVAQVRFSGDKGRALTWSRAWLGLDDGALGGRVIVTGPVTPPRAPEPEPDRDSDIRAAKAIWLGGRPIAGTPAARYLAGRGLELALFGRAPRALRFRPDTWCAERQAPAPAMLGAIFRGGRFVAVHRTWLAERPEGGWVKAALDAPKKVRGPARGGLIPLWRGAAGTPLAEITPEETLALTEGIEDGLTVALHRPEWRVAATVSLGNMADVVLPEGARDIVLVFDRDGENPSARAARERAIEAHLRAGRQVRAVKPPEGFKDFNDWHQAQQHAAPARAS